jgi:hypothetical protein
MPSEAFLVLELRSFPWEDSQQLPVYRRIGAVHLRTESSPKVD